MSKNFGKPSRRGPPEKIESRPSVFERLGVRSHHRDNAPPPNFPPLEVHGGSRWPDPPPMGHHSGTREVRRGVPPPDSGRRRTPSFSPPVMKGQGKEVKQASNTTPKKNKDGKQKTPRSEARQSSKKDKKKKVGEGKKGSEKKKRKEKTSSVSSGETSDDSSSSSRSSSSSTSSSSNSSSSDSSVPSIKLKNEKGKMKKSSKSKLGEKKGIMSSRSSSSEIEPKMKRGPIPVDLREKLNVARSPSGMRDQYSLKGKLGDHPLRRKPFDNSSPSPLINDDRYKKRPLLPDTYQMDDMKRRRITSPSPSADKYRMPHPDEPHRRAPPQQMHDIPKRIRSPDNFHKEQHHQRGGDMRRPDSRSDMRRPERPDFRNDRDRGGDRRSSPFSHHHAPKPDFDNRRRDPPGDFVRDNRPRERLAPTRTMDNRQDRDRMDNRNMPDYQQQRRPQQRPERPPFNQPDNNRMGNYRGPPPSNYDRERPKFPQEEKRQPLLPKSKEALAERYEHEQMKNKSGYIDKWVDETLKTTQHPVAPELRSPNFGTRSIKSNNSVTSSTEDRLKLEGLNKKPAEDSEILVPDDLSDFSDDADELLNTVPVDSPPESGVVVEPLKSAVSPRKEPTIIEKSSTIETRRRTASVDTAPSMLSQGRSSLKARVRDEKSLQSQSQTDDDILETMDFEEISDEELGEVENRVRIVDALGVDWASLVCQEKKNNSENLETESKSTSARKRWNPVNVLSSMNISKSLLGETLFNRIAELKKLENSENSESNAPQTKDMGILEKLGLGPNCRALSSRRDMAVRRHLLGLPNKSLLSMDVIRSNASNATPPEVDSVGELYKMSIALLKNTKPVPAITASS